MCTNTDGSYECSCNEGYVIEGGKKSCLGNNDEVVL